MTEAERQELLDAIDRAGKSDLSGMFLAALLICGGVGAFLLLYSITEIFPWRTL